MRTGPILRFSILALTASLFGACSGTKGSLIADSAAPRSAAEQALLDRRVEIAQHLHEALQKRMERGILSRDELSESQRRLLEARLAAAKDSMERAKALEDAIAWARTREESLKRLRDVGQATAGDVELAEFERLELEIELARMQAAGS